MAQTTRSGRVAGKTAIVTGGASGIGEATCLLLAEHQSGVVIADIDESKGKALEARIVENGGEAVFQRLDVTSEEDWDRVVQYTMDWRGRLDIVVNNAGMSGPQGRAAVLETTVENWNMVMNVNSTGVFLGTRAAIEPMRRSGGGSIINISSIYGIVGSKASAVYHASKGAVRTFTKAAAVSYATDGIRVNSVHPGFADTPMTLELHGRPGVREEREAVTPLGRLGTAEDIAWGILYLASDEASFMTGAELVIDGGMIAR
jgi:NAD(P)-dependent dehydrogenase (short-subunit alcohol dehydrogenase family)